MGKGTGGVVELKTKEIQKKTKKLDPKKKQNRKLAPKISKT